MDLNLLLTNKELPAGLVYFLLGVCFLLICVMILIIHVYKKLREDDLLYINEVFPERLKDLHNTYLEQRFLLIRLETKEDELNRREKKLKIREDELCYQEANFAIKLFTLIEIYKQDNTKSVELQELIILQQEFSNTVTDITKT